MMTVDLAAYVGDTGTDSCWDTVLVDQWKHLLLLQVCYSFASLMKKGDSAADLYADSHVEGSLKYKGGRKVEYFT